MTTPVVEVGLRMDPVVRQRWVEALRSGKYKQGQKILANRRRTKHCCLGVLCELAAEDGIVNVVDLDDEAETGQRYGVIRHDDITIYRGEGEKGDYTVLPLSVQQWAGLADPNPRVRGRGLAEYNDGREGIDGNPRQHSFSEIADLIEEYL